MPADRVEAVERALTILDAFRPERPRLALTELAAATGLYKSTILRLAGSLERFDYLTRAPDGSYRLGSALARLSVVYRASFELADIIRPELRKLVEATGETASFYVRDGDRRVCLYRHNSPHAARHHLDEGAQLSLNAGASAHVLRAFTELADARYALLRKRAYHVSLGERDPHVAAIAAPVFDGSGAFRGALAVSGLLPRFDDKARKKALPLLQGCVRRLASAITSMPPTSR
jgi:DNA-binding IclR family transcriptional regulator